MRRLLTFRTAPFVAVALLVTIALTPARSQIAPPILSRAESVTVVAGAEYRAGPLHRWLAGNLYRDLWVMPVRIPLLDLNTFDGGLRPTKAGGGLQTKSLRFESANGVEYVFRLTDKVVLSGPEGLKHTPMARVFQDGVSAMHPAGAMMAAPIIEASGILHPTAILVVIPDDSLLGKFQGEFAGRLGMLEAYPNVSKDGRGFGGATKIIDSDSLLYLLNHDAREHVNARAFLAARLTDFFINDNDRHPGNWRWALLDSGSTTQWEPIARDRDHAFVSYDGWPMTIARLVGPGLVLLGSTPSVPGLTQNKGLDARLLAGLSKPAWDSVTRRLQLSFTDAVIDDAAMAMPVEYQGSAPRLVRLLKKRRAALPLAADQFYRSLTARVEIHGTDDADRVMISHVSASEVDVRLESKGTPSFTRRFSAQETGEILVYLHNGDDSAFVMGTMPRGITIRVIGGNGSNTLVDSSVAAGERSTARLYDRGTVSGVSYGLDTLFDRRPWEKSFGELAPHQRDDGSAYRPVGGISYHRQLGIMPRFGVARYSYGFSRRPYATMLKLEGEYPMAYQGVRVALSADHRLEASPVHFTALARGSGIEVVNFNGLGNSTSDAGPTGDYFAVHQTSWLFHPAIALAIGERTDLSLGPVFQHATTDLSRSRYLAVNRPYGIGSFNQAGVQVDARYEWRGLRAGEEHTHHRVLAEFNGTYYPAALDVQSAFAKAAITLGTSITLPIPVHPFLVLRSGAAKLLGDFPYYEAATIGGGGTTRYMDTQRYAGDGSLFATSELRVPIARFNLVIPLRAGIVGLAEAGRVYNDGRSPGGWHSRTGEGIWFGRGDASSVLTLTRTTEPGHSGLQIRLGLNF